MTEDLLTLAEQLIDDEDDDVRSNSPNQSRKQSIEVNNNLIEKGMKDINQQEQEYEQ